MEEKDIKIVKYSNVTPEGIEIHLNKKSRLIGGHLQSSTFWISWDKIGKCLIENYGE